MNQEKDVKYFINESGEFVVENYNHAKPFSDFLPAIAGINGKPVWCFYVNRGQCVSSFGTNNKNNAILEFYGAAKAYMQTSRQGFRTFLKVNMSGSSETKKYEPFQEDRCYSSNNIKNSMFISSEKLKIEETNADIGIKTVVEYYTLPNEKIGSLIRKVTLKNIGKEQVKIQMADGIPFIISYPLEEYAIKNMSNLCQTSMFVQHHEEIPYYSIPVLPADSVEEIFVTGGNFYTSFNFTQVGTVSRLPMIVDPEYIFGMNFDFSYPSMFFSDSFEIPEKQVTQGKYPCAFGVSEFGLLVNEEKSFYTLTGFAEKYEKIIDFTVNKLSLDYIERKITESTRIVENLKNPITTMSGKREFDLYCGQTYLDNCLRGGYPISVGGGKHIFYAYSRRHADLERDYNQFQIDATYFSQGNGNYRDMNQNRRNDIYFHPFVGDANLQSFINFIQLDGFNSAFRLKAPWFVVEGLKELEKILLDNVIEDQINLLNKFLSKSFTIGTLLQYIEDEGIALKNNNNLDFVDMILKISVMQQEIDINTKYFVDHWTYNTDLLESYYSIFPDNIVDVLFLQIKYTYYDSDLLVQPRSNKYVYLKNRGVRQLESVVRVAAKETLIKSRSFEPNKVRTRNGKGAIYRSSLMTKFMSILINKIASIDPFGRGVEMEAGNCGWNDSLNLLPTIFGSSINESSEIKRLSELLLKIISNHKISDAEKVMMPIELATFFDEICNLLKSEKEDFKYWDLSNSSKERFREDTFMGINGKEEAITVKKIKMFLKEAILKVDSGLKNSIDEKSGIHFTYFYSEVIEYKEIIDNNKNVCMDKKQNPYVQVIKFIQKPLPLFLEGPVHVLRLQDYSAKEMYENIKKTCLYDKKLKMYITCENLSHMPKEIGRQTSMPRGWFENEAVFMHMEYKYMLEILRNGLHDEFFEDLKTILVPFLRPEIYGRSILENCSFIASSVNVDEKNHGRGFQPRLTGTCSEMLSMWIMMTVGEKLFTLDKDEKLCLTFQPSLPNWMFTEKSQQFEFIKDMNVQKVELPKASFAFTLMGKSLVVYNNETMKNTYGVNGANIQRIICNCSDGTTHEILGDTLCEPYSRYVREGLIDKIEIFLR